VTPIQDFVGDSDEDEEDVKAEENYEAAPNATKHPGFRDENYDDYPSRFMKRS